MLSKFKSRIRKAYQIHYDFILGVLASSLVFIKPATALIFLFVLINLIFLRKIHFDKQVKMCSIIIAAPLIFHLFFLWNNESIFEGIKHLEKYLVMFFFPLLIVGQNIKISIDKIFKVYSICFTLLLIIGLTFHVVINHDLFSDYLQGVLVWQMGYKFANSLNTHAPALNMHVAFLVVVNFYLLLKDTTQNRNYSVLIYRFILFFLSILTLFILNTRVAMLNAFFGLLLVTYLELKNKFRKLILFLCGTIIIVGFSFAIFLVKFPYIINKYSSVTFKHMDKIGNLDDIENPEKEVYSALVTRLSIWKTTIDLSKRNLLIGVGAADGKKRLFKAYKDTNQIFLEKHSFPVHNQYLDFLLKFGILGYVFTLAYMINIYFIANQTKVSLAYFFFILFSTSNLTDDFLIRFDGIIFSAFWVSVFLSQKSFTHLNKPFLNY